MTPFPSNLSLWTPKNSYFLISKNILEGIWKEEDILERKLFFNPKTPFPVLLKQSHRAGFLKLMVQDLGLLVSDSFLADISVRYNRRGGAFSAFLRWKNAALPSCLAGSRVKVKTTLALFVWKISLQPDRWTCLDISENLDKEEAFVLFFQRFCLLIRLVSISFFSKS